MYLIEDEDGAPYPPDVQEAFARARRLHRRAQAAERRAIRAEKRLTKLRLMLSRAARSVVDAARRARLRSEGPTR